MRTLRTQVTLALFVLLLSGCGVGLCVGSGECVGGNALTFDLAVDFGTRSFLSSFDHTLTISNTSSSEITDVQGAITAPFSFKGGAFPGEGGTCTMNIASGVSCTLVIAFEVPAPPVQTFNGALTLSYKLGGTPAASQIELRGVSDNAPFVVGNGIGGKVNAVRSAPEGVYVGGTFNSLGPYQMSNIGRFTHSGEVDTTFQTGTGFDNWVFAMAMAPDGSGIYVGGNFSSFNGTATSLVVKLKKDGSLDTSFAPAAFGGFPLEVLAITATTDGTGDIYVGGGWSSYNSIANNGLIRLRPNGTQETSFNTGTGVAGGNLRVKAIAMTTDGTNRVYVGGSFATYNGSGTINGIMRVNPNGSRDATFNTGTGMSDQYASVYSIAVAKDGSNDVYVSGDWTSLNGAATNGLIRLNSNGTRDMGFPAVLTPVATGTSGYSVVVDDSNELFVGGRFFRVNSTDQRSFTRFAPNGTLSTTFLAGSGFDGTVTSSDLVGDGTGDIYVAGQFASYQGTVGSRGLVRIKPDGSARVSYGITGFSEGAKNVTIIPDGQGSMYILDAASGMPETKKYKNKARRLRLDGTLDTGFAIGEIDASAASALYAVAALPDGRVYVGGEFNSIGGSSINGFARLNADGTVDSTFAMGTGLASGNYVSAIVFTGGPNDPLYIGGNITSYNGTTINYIARILPSGALDSTFDHSTGFDFYVLTLSMARDGSGDVFAGGYFSTYKSAPASYIARIRPTGAAAPFQQTTGFNNSVGSVYATSDGGVLAAGTFTTYNSVTTRRLVYLNGDGTIKTSFGVGTGFNSEATSVIHDSLTNGVYVGGKFTTYQGGAVRQIVRLNMDGTVDAGFNIGTGGYRPYTSTFAMISNMITTDDGTGDFYVAGDFQSINGTTANGLARLNRFGKVE